MRRNLSLIHRTSDFQLLSKALRETRTDLRFQADGTHAYLLPALDLLPPNLTERICGFTYSVELLNQIPAFEEGMRHKVRFEETKPDQASSVKELGEYMRKEFTTFQMLNTLDELAFSLMLKSKRFEALEQFVASVASDPHQFISVKKFALHLVLGELHKQIQDYSQQLSLIIDAVPQLGELNSGVFIYPNDTGNTLAQSDAQTALDASFDFAMGLQLPDGLPDDTKSRITNRSLESLLHNYRAKFEKAKNDYEADTDNDDLKNVYKSALAQYKYLLERADRTIRDKIESYSTQYSNYVSPENSPPESLTHETISQWAITSAGKDGAQLAEEPYKGVLAQWQLMQGDKFAALQKKFETEQFLLLDRDFVTAAIDNAKNKKTPDAYAIAYKRLTWYQSQHNDSLPKAWSDFKSEIESRYKTGTNDWKPEFFTALNAIEASHQQAVGTLGGYKRHFSAAFTDAKLFQIADSATSPLTLLPTADVAYALRKINDDLAQFDEMMRAIENAQRESVRKLKKSERATANKNNKKLNETLQNQKSELEKTKAALTQQMISRLESGFSDDTKTRNSAQAGLVAKIFDDIAGLGEINDQQLPSKKYRFKLQGPEKLFREFPEYRLTARFNEAIELPFQIERKTVSEDKIEKNLYELYALKGLYRANGGSQSAMINVFVKGNPSIAEVRSRLEKRKTNNPKKASDKALTQFATLNQNFDNPEKLCDAEKIAVLKGIYLERASKWKNAAAKIFTPGATFDDVIKRLEERAKKNPKQSSADTLKKWYQLEEQRETAHLKKPSLQYVESLKSAYLENGGSNKAMHQIFVKGSPDIDEVCTRLERRSHGKSPLAYASLATLENNRLLAQKTLRAETPLTVIMDSLSTAHLKPDVFDRLNGKLSDLPIPLKYDADKKIFSVINRSVSKAIEKLKLGSDSQKDTKEQKAARSFLAAISPEIARVNLLLMNLNDAHKKVITPEFNQKTLNEINSDQLFHTCLSDFARLTKELAVLMEKCNEAMRSLPAFSHHTKELIDAYKKVIDSNSKDIKTKTQAIADFLKNKLLADLKSDAPLSSEETEQLIFKMRNLSLEKRAEFERGVADYFAEQILRVPSIYYDVREEGTFVIEDAVKKLEELCRDRLFADPGIIANSISFVSDLITKQVDANAFSNTQDQTAYAVWLSNSNKSANDCFNASQRNNPFYELAKAAETLHPDDPRQFVATLSDLILSKIHSDQSIASYCKTGSYQAEEPVIPICRAIIRGENTTQENFTCVFDNLENLPADIQRGFFTIVADPENYLDGSRKADALSEFSAALNQVTNPSQQLLGIKTDMIDAAKAELDAAKNLNQFFAADANEQRTQFHRVITAYDMLHSFDGAAEIAPCNANIRETLFPMLLDYIAHYDLGEETRREKLNDALLIALFEKAGISTAPLIDKDGKFDQTKCKTAWSKLPLFEQKKAFPSDPDRIKFTDLAIATLAAFPDAFAQRPHVQATYHIVELLRAFRVADAQIIFNDMLSDPSIKNQFLPFFWEALKNIGMVDQNEPVPDDTAATSIEVEDIVLAKLKPIIEPVPDSAVSEAFNNIISHGFAPSRIEALYTALEQVKYGTDRELQTKAAEAIKSLQLLYQPVKQEGEIAIRVQRAYDRTKWNTDPNAFQQFFIAELLSDGRIADLKTALTQAEQLRAITDWTPFAARCQALGLSLNLQEDSTHITFANVERAIQNQIIKTAVTPVLHYENFSIGLFDRNDNLRILPDIEAKKYISERPFSSANFEKYKLVCNIQNTLTAIALNYASDTAHYSSQIAALFEALYAVTQMTSGTNLQESAKNAIKGLLETLPISVSIAGLSQLCTAETATRPCQLFAEHLIQKLQTGESLTDSFIQMPRDNSASDLAASVVSQGNRDQAERAQEEDSSVLPVESRRSLSPSDALKTEIRRALHPIFHYKKFGTDLFDEAGKLRDLDIDAVKALKSGITDKNYSDNFPKYKHALRIQRALDDIQRSAVEINADKLFSIITMLLNSLSRSGSNFNDLIKGAITGVMKSAILHQLKDNLNDLLDELAPEHNKTIADSWEKAEKEARRDSVAAHALHSSVSTFHAPQNHGNGNTQAAAPVRTERTPGK